MKDRLMNNLGLKILSLLIAIIIWVMIINVDDPVITRKFEDVQVTVQNSEAITSKDKVYNITGGNVVDIIVSGRRSIVNRLTKSDLVAVADLSKLSITGAVNIEVQVPKAFESSLTINLGNTKTLTVELEDKISKKYPVEIQLSGEIATGHTISEKSASPNMITVSGAESVISKINKVIVEINVQGKMTTFQTPVVKDAFQVIDNNGDRISNDKLEFSDDEIMVTITLQKTKEVNLNIKTKGQPKNGYRLAEFEYEPKTIIVTGDDASLDALSTITYEYDISDKYEDYEENLAIRNDLLEVIESHGVSLVDETQTIAISIRFEKLETDEISVNKEDIDINNLASAYDVDINTEKIIALVQASTDILDKISVADLKPYIDLSGYIKGTALVNVKFAGEGEYEILNMPTINITIKEASSSIANRNGVD